MTILLIAVGGFFGAICRYLVGKAFTKKNGIPNNTLIVNVSGSLLLGIVAGLHMAGVVSDSIWNFIGVGFLGAYTTMSTFGYETFTLIRERMVGVVVYYVTASITLGIIALFIGLKLTVY